MKLNRYAVILTLCMFVGLLWSGCSDDKEIDNREQEYGYVQFKLYKAASYQAESRSVTEELEYLADACKIQVTLRYGNTNINQTLTLNSVEGAAEFGLRSEKLQLLAGNYTIDGFALYDTADQVLYYGIAEQPELEVTVGGLTVHDLTVNTKPRGLVKFTLAKDFSNFNGPETRSVNRDNEYTFSDITKVNISITEVKTNKIYTFENLKVKQATYLDEEGEGYIGAPETDVIYSQHSELRCDSLLWVPAGTYRYSSISTFNSYGGLLERRTGADIKQTTFTVEDNEQCEAKVPVTLQEADAYIQDYYALYTIWKALDGPHWYYEGDTGTPGSNWNFNKDIDLWGKQPGVTLHSNGRVSRLDLSGFGIRGAMPAALGQLTELMELYLGNHNELNIHTFDPTLQLDLSLSERGRNRMEFHKQYLRMIHPGVQMSEPCARALMEHKQTSPAIALYEQGYTEDQIFDKANRGRQREIIKMDMNHGQLTNGLTSLPEEINKLSKLEYFFLANSPIAELPDLSGLKSVTDLEIYNCPNLTKFPTSLSQIGVLTSVNLGTNQQWSTEEIEAGLKALSTGPSAQSLQIMYLRANNIVRIPSTFRNMKRLGLLDLAYNKIEEFPAMGNEFAPVQLILDHNNLTSLGTEMFNGRRIFCNTDDIETFSCNYNKFTKFPDIFSSQRLISMGSVSFAYNEIDGFENEENGYQGILVGTLTLSGNRLKHFPKCLGDTDSYVSYLLLNGNQIDEFPEGCFKGKYSSSLVSLDLTYNNLTEIPKDFTAEDLPYFYGLDVSYNCFASFQWAPLNCPGLTVYGIRGQRNANGERCLREWPTGIYQHNGLRGFYIGSNDLRKITDTISPNIYLLDISDNPNITFDASDICSYWRAGYYQLIYDKTQNIINCDAMLN